MLLMFSRIRTLYSYIATCDVRELRSSSFTERLERDFEQFFSSSRVRGADNCKAVKVSFKKGPFGADKIGCPRQTAVTSICHFASELFLAMCLQYFLCSILFVIVACSETQSDQDSSVYQSKYDRKPVAHHQADMVPLDSASVQDAYMGVNTVDLGLSTSTQLYFILI
jgi:hypothetical protein